MTNVLLEESDPRLTPVLPPGFSAKKKLSSSFKLQR